MFKLPSLGRHIVYHQITTKVATLLQQRQCNSPRTTTTSACSPPRQWTLEQLVIVVDVLMC